MPVPVPMLVTVALIRPAPGDVGMAGGVAVVVILTLVRLGHECLACVGRLSGRLYVFMYARDNESGTTMSQEQPDRARVEAAVAAFRMLSDATRLRLMWLLASGEYDVSSLSRMVAVARPSVSQHLAKLRMAGLVRTRRDGRRVLYRATDTHVRTLIAEALSHADHEVSGTPRHE
ncbi:ArsR/SmtB family transcription factor [Microtetraspora malaysiensis]|uniref:ArsR/SmtB family transcription factor n=1 Tax=Microtetraspora malaysiensis TaxID=161358 RepID=UPI003D8A5AD1